MHIVTYLFHLAACSTQDTLQVSVTSAEKIPSVLHVSVSPSRAGSVWISGESEQQSWQTEKKEAQDSVAFTLLGLHPNSEHTITVHWTDQQGNTQERSDSILVPPLGDISSALPLDVEQNQETEGYLFGTIFGDPAYLVLLDMEGRILWGIQQGDSLHGGIDSDTSTDRSLIYFNQFHKDKNIDDASIQMINWLGESQGAIQTPFAHHMFDILPDNSLVYLAFDLRETEEHGPVCGDQIVHRSPSGNETVLFSTWDHMEVYHSAMWDFVLYPFCRDWTHGNFVEWNHDRSSYLFSMAGTDTIFELSADGTPLREITGFSAYQPQWIFEPADGVFSYPHGPRWSRDGELVFISTRQDNTSAVAYRIQDDDTVLEQTWSWGEDYGYQAYHLGEVKDVSDRLRMVNWGSVGVIQLVDNEDNVRWELHSGLSQWFAQFEYWTTLPGMDFITNKER